MTATSQNLLKKYVVLGGILLAFLTAFFGLSYLRKGADAKYLIAAADKLCRAYPGFKGKQITVRGGNNSGLSGIPFRTVLSASYSGREAFVFMLPVTGKYGVYPAVFFYEHSIGCIFCGIAGIDVDPKQAESYGITQSTITMYQNKIEALMTKPERYHDK